MSKAEPNLRLEVPDPILAKWQEMVDLMARLVGVPAARVMRIVGEDIEVLVSSRRSGNPYEPGDKKHLPESGLYCEKVLETGTRLLITNARSDKHWKNSPDLALDMVSYLGFPILLPDGRPFGTISILDAKENAYSETYEQLLLHFREIIQGNLEQLFINHYLAEMVSS